MARLARLAPLKVPQANALLALLRRHLGDALLALYRHGSAVAGGLRPQSDLDLLAVSARPLADAERRTIAADLFLLSGRHPRAPGAPRPIELMLFHAAGLAPPAYPARCDFLYGEWLRAEIESGTLPAPSSHPEFTLLLAQAHLQAQPLYGPPATALLPAIPADITRATADALPRQLALLHGDERNVLLTLARMWHTAATGHFVPKDTAADWAIPRLPPASAALLTLARDAYRGHATDHWHHRTEATRQAANTLHARIAPLLTG